MNSLTIAKLLLGMVLLHPSVQAQAVPENAAFAVDDNANKLAIPTGSGNGGYTYGGGVIAPTSAGEIRRLYFGTTVEPLYFCFTRIELEQLKGLLHNAMTRMNTLEKAWTELN